MSPLDLKSPPAVERSFAGAAAVQTQLKKTTDPESAATIAPTEPNVVEDLTLVAPAINTNPVREEEINGYRVFRPAGKTYGTVNHSSGVGSHTPNEIEQMHALAKGTYGEQFVVAGSIASKTAPPEPALRNAGMLFDALLFMSTAPEALRESFTHNMGGNGSLGQRLGRLGKTLLHPDSYYPFVFDRGPLPQDEKKYLLLRGLRREIDSFLHAPRLPNLHQMAAGMVTSAQAMLPGMVDLLDQFGASGKNVCNTGFSQGIGIAVASAALMPDRVFHMVLIDGPFYDSPHTPDFRDTSMGVDMVLTKDSSVVSHFGMSHKEIARDLAAHFAPGRATIWDQCPGDHDVKGQIAQIAGQRVVEAFRRRQYGAQTV